MPLAWRLVVDADGRAGAVNMARDQALLETARTDPCATLRLYHWDPPCLSLGRNEPALRRYDRAAIEARSLPVVRRPTGGRAVWHDCEVTYAVAAPLTEFGSLRASFAAIHTRLRAALRALGVDAECATAAERVSLEGGACFAARAGGELTVGGRKIVGSAQVREHGALLQHGSILLGGSQAMVALVSRAGADPPRETTLATLLGRSVSFAEVVTAVGAAFGCDSAPRASPLVAPPHLTGHFADPAWTWRR